MSVGNGAPRKPKSLKAGSRLGVFAPASPADSVEMIAGLTELKRQGFQVVANQDSKAEGYFAGPALDRMNGFLSGIQSEQIDGLMALRGGYGSNYLLDFDLDKNLERAKSVIGFSDVTTLQIYLWQKCRWVTFYGPMVAAGINAGAGAMKGYDENSFLQAIRKTDGSWKLRLKGEAVHSVRLIQSLTQIKRGSGIWLDLARVKCCARIARRLRRRKPFYVKAAAGLVTSGSARWGDCRCASGFVSCSTKTRRFSRSDFGRRTKCMSNGERFRRRES